MQRSFSTHALWDLDGSKTSCEPILIPSTLISRSFPCLCNVAGSIAIVHSSLQSALACPGSYTSRLFRLLRAA